MPPLKCIRIEERKSQRDLGTKEEKLQTLYAYIRLIFTCVLILPRRKASFPRRVSQSNNPGVRTHRARWTRKAHHGHP